MRSRLHPAYARLLMAGLAASLALPSRFDHSFARSTAPIGSRPRIRSTRPLTTTPSAAKVAATCSTSSNGQRHGHTAASSWPVAADRAPPERAPYAPILLSALPAGDARDAAGRASRLGLRSEVASGAGHADRTQPRRPAGARGGQDRRGRLVPSRRATHAVDDHVDGRRLPRRRGGHRDRLQELLGNDLVGIVCSDRLSAYDHLEPEQRQVCRQHLVRDFRRHAGARAKQKQFGESGLALTRRLFERWRAFQEHHDRRRLRQRATRVATASVWSPRRSTDAASMVVYHHAGNH